MIKKAITAARAATSFSFFAMPMATPMANTRGRLLNTTLPAALMTVNTAFRIVPDPMMPVRP